MSSSVNAWVENAKRLLSGGPPGPEEVQLPISLLAAIYGAQSPQ